MKRILLVNGHPKKNSFCDALAKKYKEGALDAKLDFREIILRDLNLNPYLKSEHNEKPKLSEELLSVQELINWSTHLVFVYPTWWSSPPALLKLFFETVFQSGFAFRYLPYNGIIPRWEKLLKGKSARIIVTMDSPRLYYEWIVGDPGYKMMKDILGFCGIKIVDKNYFSGVKVSSLNKRKKWLKIAYDIGLKE